MFEILRECAPYFTSFTYPGFAQVQKLCIESLKKVDSDKKFVWHLDGELCAQLAPVLEFLRPMGLSRTRMVLFVSRPGYRDTPHKDGEGHPFGINFMIQVPDNQCVTSWYDDDTLKTAPTYTVTDGGKILQKIQLPPEGKYPAAFQTVFEPNECVLFNTSIYHDWNNKSQSTTDRVVLTLRPYGNAETTFYDAHRVLFGH